MPNQVVLEEMVVKLLGDGSSYGNMWLKAQQQTNQGTNGILSKLNAFENKVKNIGNNLKAFGNNIASLGAKYSLAVTAPLTALAGAAIRETTRYETALSRMSGLVGLTKDEISGFSDEIKKLSVETGKFPLELASAMENITSSGIKGKEALETLQVTAKAAAAGLGEVRTVSDTVTSAMNAYGTANLSATSATDILVAAVREGKAEAESFAPVLGNVLPLAAEMSISFEEAAGSIAYLTLATGSASTASTQYLNVLTKVMTLNEKQDAGKVLKEAGIDIKAFQKQVSDEGLLAGLMKLKENLALKGLGFKDAFHDIQALTGILQLTGVNAAKAKEVIENVGKASGSVDKAFGAASETRAFKFNQQMAQGKIILIELGDMFSEVLSKIMGWASSGIDTWKKLNKESKELVVRILAIGAAFGPVLVVFGVLVGTVGSLIAGLATLAGMGVSLTAALLSPVGLVSLGLIRLGTVIVTQTNFGKSIFKDFTDFIYTEFKTGWDNIVALVAPAITGIKNAINQGDLGLAFDIFFSTARIGWYDLGTYLNDVWNEMLFNFEVVIAKMTIALNDFIYQESGGLGGASREVSSGIVPSMLKEHARSQDLDQQFRDNPNSVRSKMVSEHEALLGRAGGDSGGGSFDLDDGEDEKKVKLAVGTLPLTPEVESLLDPTDLEKKIHVKIDFKAAWYGTGAHFDLMEEYLSGRAMGVNHSTVKSSKKKSKTASAGSKSSALTNASTISPTAPSVSPTATTTTPTTAIAPAGSLTPPPVPPLPAIAPVTPTAPATVLAPTSVAPSSVASTGKSSKGKPKKGVKKSPFVQTKEEIEAFDKLVREADLGAQRLLEEQKEKELQAGAKKRIEGDAKDQAPVPGLDNMLIDQENLVAQKLAERKFKRDSEQGMKEAATNKETKEKVDKELASKPNIPKIPGMAPGMVWSHDQLKKKGFKFPETSSKKLWTPPEHVGWSEEELNHSHTRDGERKTAVSKSWAPDHTGWSDEELNHSWKKDGERDLGSKALTSIPNDKNLEEINLGIKRLVVISEQRAKKPDTEITLTPAGLSE